MEQAPKLPERRMGLVFSAPPPGTDPLRARLRAAYREDETQAVERILAAASLPADAVARIAGRAQGLVADARRRRLAAGGAAPRLHPNAPARRQGSRHPCDRLGGAARTAADARRYFSSYDAAIAAIGATVDGRDILAAPGISVKLSALHPRYEEAQRDRVLRELLPGLRALALRAKTAQIGFAIDAEEADRLALSLH